LIGPSGPFVLAERGERTFMLGQQGQRGQILRLT
jgi:hypothetical protein